MYPKDRLKIDVFVLLFESLLVTYLPCVSMGQ